MSDYIELDKGKFFIRRPKHRIGDPVYLVGDPTEREIANIRCFITVYPDGASSISEWAYYLTDPQGGCGPVHEYEVVTTKPVSRPEEAQSMTRLRAGYVYLLKEVNGTYYKIGRTVNPESRQKTFGVELPFSVNYEAVIQTEDRIGLEAELHALYANKRVNGEWFALSADDVAYIKSLAEVRND